MSDDRKLVLSPGPDGGLDVYASYLGDPDVTLLMSLLDPDEGMDLFGLLDRELDRCCVCNAPMWVTTGGVCAEQGRYCDGCPHPRCSVAECGAFA